MLNEERIRSMTKLAIYENNEGKKTIPLTHYYKSDYISKSMMKSFPLLPKKHIPQPKNWLLKKES